MVASDQVNAATISALAPARLMGASPNEKERFTSTATPQMPTASAAASRKVRRCVRKRMISSSVMKTGMEIILLRTHDGRDPRRHALLRPEQTSVVNQKDQCAHERCRKPLADAGRRRAPQTHPGKEQDAGDSKTQPRQQERRHFVNPNANGQES